MHDLIAHVGNVHYITLLSNFGPWEYNHAMLGPNLSLLTTWFDIYITSLTSHFGAIKVHGISTRHAILTWTHDNNDLVQHVTLWNSTKSTSQ